MSNDQLYSILENAAEESKESNPAVACVLFTLCGSMKGGQEMLLAMKMRPIAEEFIKMLQEAQERQN